MKNILIHGNGNINNRTDDECNGDESEKLLHNMGILLVQDN